jgi:hypothetical protein
MINSVDGVWSETNAQGEIYNVNMVQAKEIP